VVTFGADQFSDLDVSPEEAEALKQTFFNWFYFSINLGSAVSYTGTHMRRGEGEKGRKGGGEEGRKEVFRSNLRSFRHRLYTTKYFVYHRPGCPNGDHGTLCHPLFRGLQIL
jgi:hypothetical protein